MTENHSSFTLRLSPKCWLHTQPDKEWRQLPLHNTLTQSSTFCYYIKLWFLFLPFHKNFILLYKTKTLLIEEMLEIPNREKHEMKLLKMQMKKCPKTPKMPHRLSWAKSKQHLTALYRIWIYRDKNIISKELRLLSDNFCLSTTESAV